MAISSADICSSATWPPVYALITQPISSAVSSPPSRLARISPAASGMLALRLIPPLGQVGPGERVGQQLGQRPRRGPGLGSAVDQQAGAAGLEQQLPAPAAGHQRLAV